MEKFTNEKGATLIALIIVVIILIILGVLSYKVLLREEEENIIGTSVVEEEIKNNDNITNENVSALLNERVDSAIKALEFNNSNLYELSSEERQDNPGYYLITNFQEIQNQIFTTNMQNKIKETALAENSNLKLKFIEDSPYFKDNENEIEQYGNFSIYNIIIEEEYLECTVSINFVDENQNVIDNKEFNAKLVLDNDDIWKFDSFDVLAF